jgi:serine/threonine protein kinase
LVELFREDVNSYNKECLTVVTTDVNISLDSFIRNLDVQISNIELLDFMKQVLLALQCFHKKNRYFEIGVLKETNIYLSTLLDTVLIDPGFYYDEEKEEVELHEIEQDKDGNIFPLYLKSPENESSPQSDIYAAGFIFFRLASGYSPEDIQQIYHKKEKKSKGWLKNIADRISSPGSASESESVDEYEDKPRLIDHFYFTKGLTPEYIINMKDEFLLLRDRYDTRILNVIIQMIDENPNKRPKIEDLLKLLSGIYRELKKGTIRASSNKFGSLNDVQKILVAHDNYRQYFKEYLRTEFSSETLLFFEDVKSFQNLSTDQERIIKANEICQSYLKVTSELEINVSGILKRNVTQEIKNAEETGKLDIDVFDDMAKHVCDTILLDSTFRFEQSAIREEMVSQFENEKKQMKKSKAKIFK